MAVSGRTAIVGAYRDDHAGGVDAGSAYVFSLGSPSAPRDVELLDVNGDGDLDVATANEGSGDVGLRANNGTGTLATESTVALTAANLGPVALARGDLDNDGCDDVVVANQGSDDVTVLMTTQPALAQVYGIACGGPTISAVGMPTSGNPAFGVRVSNARTTAPMLLMFSLAPADFALPPSTCRLLLSNPIAQLLFTDGSGQQTCWRRRDGARLRDRPVRAGLGPARRLWPWPPADSRRPPATPCRQTAHVRATGSSPARADASGKGDFADYFVREHVKAAGCNKVAIFDKASFARRCSCRRDVPARRPMIAVCTRSRARAGVVGSRHRNGGHRTTP